MGLFRVFYTVGIPVSILAGLLILFGISGSSGSGRFLDFAYLGFLFRNIDPYFWAALGVAFAIGLSVLGAAWCVRRGHSWRWRCCRTAAAAPNAAGPTLGAQSAPRCLRATRNALTGNRRVTQGHLHHRLELGGRCGEGAAHHVEKPHQARRAARLRPSRHRVAHAAATGPGRCGAPCHCARRASQRARAVARR